MKTRHGLALLALTLSMPAAARAQADLAPTDPLTPTTTTPPTTATIAPSLSPDRLGAKATLTFTIRYSGGASGVPSAVRRSVVRLPAGLSLDIPKLRSCSAARLRARGPTGCPARSRIGSGHALAAVRAGSQLIKEPVGLQAFLGPPNDAGEPTFEVLGRGYSPVDEHMVIAGTVLPDKAPYGEALVIPIPPIPSLRYEPDASIVSLSLKIGTGGHGANSVRVPSSCPAGGFPFAGEFTYADGTTGSALATAPCPGAPAAVSARAVPLNETGHLHVIAKHGFTLTERGPASGTFTGTIYVHLTIVSTSRVQATVSVYRNGGSISGSATASYRRSGATASFSGSLSISRGSGSYSHAHGSRLSFSGTIQNSNDAIAVHLGGTVSD